MAGVPVTGRGRPMVLCVVLAAVRVAGLVLLLSAPATHHHGHVLVADVARLREVAKSPTLTPRHAEYPPLAVGAAKVVAAPGRFHAAVTRLGIAMLVADLLAAGALLWGFGIAAALSYLVVGLPLLPFVYFRIDLLAVLAATAAMALVARRRPIAGGVALAAGAFVKVWPVVLIPILFARRQHRAAVAGTAAGAVGLAAWIVAAGAGAVVSVLTFRHARGLHIESVAGALWRAAGGNGRAVFEAGAMRTGPVPAWVRVLLTVALVAVIAAVTRTAARTTARTAARITAAGPETDPAVSQGAPEVAVVAALLVASPLLSPQYVSWLLPFIAIATAAGVAHLERLGLLAAALTTAVVVEFGSLRAGAGAAEAMVIARNVVLVALAVAAARAIAPRDSRPAPRE